MESYIQDGYKTRKLYSQMMNDDSTGDDAFVYIENQMYNHPNRVEDSDQDLTYVLEESDLTRTEIETVLHKYDLSKYEWEDIIDFIEDIRELGI